MAGDGCPRLCSENNIRVSHTLSTNTSSESARPQKRATSHYGIGRDDFHCPTDEKAGRSKSSRCIPEFHLSHISRAKKRWLPTAYIQSEITEPVCANRSVSAHKHAPNSRLSTTSGLAMQSGPVAGVLSSANSQVAQAVFATNLQRRNHGNDMSSIWVKHSTEDLCVFNQLDSTNSSRQGCQASGIPRRLPGRTPKSKCSVQARNSAIDNVKVPRLPCELRQVCACTAKTYNLSRDSLEPLDKSQVPAERKVCGCNQKNLSGSKNWQNNIERTTKSSRVVKFCQLRGSSWKTKPPSCPKVFEHIAESHDFGEVPSPVPRNRRDALVDSELFSTNPIACASAHSFSGNRCLRCGMGSTAQPSSNVWHLEPRRATTPQQSERVACHSQSSGAPCTCHGTNHNIDSIGQPISGGLSPQRRRDQIPGSNESNVSDPSSPRRSGHSSKNSSHSWKVQQSGRLSIQTSPTPRMAFATDLHRNDFCKDGDPGSGSICIQNSSCGSELCNIGPQRSPSDVPRRVQRNVELSVGMDFRTTISCSQGANAPQPSQGCVSSSGPSVAKSILESGPQIPESRSPIHIEESESVSGRHDNGPSTSQSSRHDFGNLEMWGWSEKIKSWHPTQVSLLMSSWRPSTWKTYKVAWNRWVIWAKHHKVNPTHPEGSELAQFLADLHLTNKLSYNTILLHKSVISTLCNAELSGKLSEDVLVKHILKSVSLKNPKSKKPPVWDIDIVTVYMSTYKVDCKNIFQTVRHTATLLALCSGRRIHDLTLLSVDPQHCRLTDNDIIFWPLFGSKTDCSVYRQSGWKLLSNPQNLNLNPVYWINKTISILNERRSQSGTSNLFTTLRGSPSPASRTVIAGWVKSLLKEAGITATPGSTRSAVASSNWINNFPLDDILARGNWKSAKTFQNYYRREVMASSSNYSTITTLFNPVD